MPGFRFLRVFNDSQLATLAGSKTRIGRNTIQHFPGTRLSDRLIHELARERSLPIKEIVEAFEFFAVTRKYIRTKVVVDLCAGHGLAGLLFGLLQERTERVLLFDRRKPQSYDSVLRAAERVVPGIGERVEYVEARIANVRSLLPEGSGVIGVHACGALTDACLDLAAEVRGPAGVLPCCRSHSRNAAPRGLRAALGEDVAYDVHRTYAMEERGYRVRWREIPEEITPMNRVLIAVPKPPTPAEPAALAPRP